MAEIGPGAVFKGRHQFDRKKKRRRLSRRIWRGLVEAPFAAYEGDEPCIFVCYAHEDSDVVYPEMAWLREQGLNLWYDEGISAGKNWRAAIGELPTWGSSHSLLHLGTFARIRPL